MRSITPRAILILLLCACTTTRTPATPTTPPTPEPVTQPVDSGPWHFFYHSDTVGYRVKRVATIESQADSGTQHVLSTNNTHEVLMLSSASDTVRYVATVDSFATVNDPPLGSVPVINVPIRASGVIDSIGLQTDSAGPDQRCDPVRSSLESDVRNLLVSLPARLTSGTSWRDSTATTTCYGTIPLKATVIRNFSVAGSTSYNTQRAIAIQRTDSVSAHGEGRQQQHQLGIDVRGTGTATYYLSPEQNSLVYLTTSQDLQFVIRAPNRSSQFRESAKEEFTPLR